MTLNSMHWGINSSYRDRIDQKSFLKSRVSHRRTLLSNGAHGSSATSEKRFVSLAGNPAGIFRRSTQSIMAHKFHSIHCFFCLVFFLNFIQPNILFLLLCDEIPLFLLSASLFLFLCYATTIFFLCDDNLVFLLFFCALRRLTLSNSMEQSPHFPVKLYGKTAAFPACDETLRLTTWS